MSLINRAQFSDLFFSTKLPALREVIFEKFGMHDPKGPQIFNVINTDRDIEQTTSISSLGNMIETGEGAPVTYEALDQGFDKTYNMVKYTLGVKISREALEDDERNVMRRVGSAIPRSATHTMETILANHFNNGFDSSFAGPDGKELFATDHPLESGGTQSNELATPADLTITSLNQALTDFRDFRDGKNKRLNIRPRFLVVPPALEAQALQLLNSTLLPGGDQNDINPIPSRSNLQLIVWDFLTDADAWFLVGDKSDHELRMYMREAFNLQEDIDFDHDALKIKGVMRWDSDWSDYRAVYGTPGAA